MKSAISRGLGVLAFCFGAMLVTSATLSQWPPTKGKLGECDGGKDYGVDATCFESPFNCSGTTGCVTLDNAYACPNNACGVGGCHLFKGTEFDSMGYCIYREGTSKKCTRCDWFACAFGDYYADSTNCAAGTNKKCTGLLWYDGTCDAPLEE